MQDTVNDVASKLQRLRERISDELPLFTDQKEAYLEILNIDSDELTNLFQADLQTLYYLMQKEKNVVLKATEEAKRRQEENETKLYALKLQQMSILPLQRYGGQVNFQWPKGSDLAAMIDKQIQPDQLSTIEIWHNKKNQLTGARITQKNGL